MSEKRHKVEVSLEPELYEKFLKLKKELWFITNSDLLRAIITTTYRRVVEKGEELF